MNNSRTIDTKHIDVLDGIRAISVIIVLIFHFWQQTWIFPIVQTPWLSFLGINQINITNYAKVGYLFVDMMVLISGFLLFLPVARHVLLGESMDSWKVYARKRVSRIIPSYCFCVIALFIYSLALGRYSTTADAVLDLITHLTFTQTLFAKTYFSTNLNVVLWTLSIEVWFYILFPFIAGFIKHGSGGRNGTRNSLIKVAAAAVIMYALFIIYKDAFVYREGAYLSILINQFPAFLAVYANGMIAAFVFVGIAKEQKRTPLIEYISLFLAVISLFTMNKLISGCAALSSADAQIWQVKYRFTLTLCFSMIIITLGLSPKWVRWIFSNRFMRFLSGISYNLYIWHQWLCVELKQQWRIPAWTGDTPPNQLGDKAWMNKYALIITVVAFAAAILATYLIEKPCSNLIMGKPAFRKRSSKTMKAE